MTARTEHTPGPWKAEQRGNEWGIFRTLTSESQLGETTRVLSFPIGVIPYPEDGRLLESAPALLAACEETLALLIEVKRPGEAVCASIVKLRAAVAQARGSK